MHKKKADATRPSSDTAGKIKKGKEKIPATLRNVVWCNYIGSENTTGLCYCCGVERISKANFAVGHVKPEALGGTLHASNLRPVCTLCNSSMGKTDMYDFIKKYGLGGNRVSPKKEKKKWSCAVL